MKENTLLTANSGPRLNAEASATVAGRPLDAAVGELTTTLGPTLVAFMCDTIPQDVTKWKDPTSDLRPSPSSLSRLNDAYQAHTYLSDILSPLHEGGWFMEANPMLAGSSPAIAMRDGRGSDVTAAAHHYRTSIIHRHTYRTTRRNPA